MENILILMLKKLILGQKEVDENTVNYRKYGSKDQFAVTLDEFVNTLK